MENRFESELGKRIVEGNRRKVTKKMAVVAFAMVSAALFFGTAAFSFVTSAQYAPYMTAETLFDHEQSTIDNLGGSAAVSRTMTLMTRAFDVETGGGAHVDCFKFVYVMNVSIVDTDTTVYAGDDIGDLALLFASDVPMPSVGLILTVEATTYAADGTPMTVDGYSGVTMAYSTITNEDQTMTVTGITVDANAPVDLIGTGSSMSLYIDVWVYYLPIIEGTATEIPFGGASTDLFFEEFPIEVIVE
jgi:hypothetical protein